MKFASKDFIINTVYRTNILPVISECNTSCVFCSHKQNPDGVEIFRMPKLELEDFEDIIDFLSPNKKIVIGEAATRIVEGEPLLHKDFLNIVSRVRRKFKNTPIQVTTNGILLNEALLGKLEELRNIEFNISVNGADSEKRRQLLGLKNNDDIGEKLGMLKGRFKYSGSFVLVPEILDWKDCEDIIKLLDTNGADTVRLFLPGYTSKVNKSMDLKDIFLKTCSFVDIMRERYDIPIIVEPSFINGLECNIEGIIRNSPALRAGLRVGDKIVKVNKENVESRVHGFNLAYKALNPILSIQRDDTLLNVGLTKKKNTSPGFVVLYDIDCSIAEGIAATAERHRAGKVLILTSELAGCVLRELCKKSSFSFEYDIVSVRNAFFGGTIKCAGLLTVSDVLECLGKHVKSTMRPDLVMLPSIMFDFKNRDLLGRSVKEIEETIKIPVDTV